MFRIEQITNWLIVCLYDCSILSELMQLTSLRYALGDYHQIFLLGWRSMYAIEIVSLFYVFTKVECPKLLQIFLQTRETTWYNFSLFFLSFSVYQCMDFGYHNALQRSMLLYNSCLENVKSSHQNSIDCIVKCVQELDPNKDKQNFLKANRFVHKLR